MKKRLMIIASIILCAVLLFYGIRYLTTEKNPAAVNEVQVTKVTLYTFSHDENRSAEIELTEQEWKKAIKLYNRGRDAGWVTGQPCCDSYRLEIYLTDGRKIHVSDGMGNKSAVWIKGSESFYLLSDELLDYIIGLIHQYNLPSDRA